jgi:Patatin-like phospholipase
MADFARVLQDELEIIKHRRIELLRESAGEERARGPSLAVPAERRPRARRIATTVVPEQPGAGESNRPESAEMAARLRALDLHIAGLAISGGGIRSATFALGVIQALAHLKLLRRFDYLSTVSGGGYIGSWLSAWIRREGSIANVELQLAPSRVEQSEAERRLLSRGLVVDEEPEALKHLRAYSDYLTPRLGVLTPDTWTILAIYFRNILINLLMLVPATVAFVLAARLIVVLPYVAANTAGPRDAFGGWGATLAGLAVAVGLLARAFWANSVALAELRRVATLADGTNGRPLGPGSSPRRKPKPMSEARLVKRVVVPVVIAAWLMVWVFLQIDRLREDFRSLHPGVDRGAASAWTPTTWWIVIPFTLMWGAGLYVLHTLAHRDHGGPSRSKQGKAAVLSGLLGGSLFSLLLIWVLFTNNKLDDALGPAVATLGPPLALLVIVVAFLAEVAVLGGTIGEAEREWWARLSAWLLMAAVAWSTLFGCILFVPALLITINDRYVNTGIVAGWITTTVGGLLAGRSRRTKDGSGTPGLEWLGLIAPHVFLAGLITAVSLLVDFLVNDPQPRFSDVPLDELLKTYWHGLVNARGRLLLSWMVLTALFAWVMGRVVEVNLFSLNNMYANRLIRCYLGASRPKEGWRSRWVDGAWVSGGGGAPTDSRGPDRQQNRVTGFDPNDDIPLTDLGPATGRRKPYTGPYHLINTSLNLVAGKELAWRDRKAESFVISPAYCGCNATGYAPMTAVKEDSLTLGRAVAISGAAVDPNMNYHQSPSLTALLAIFNARLGWWLQNPAKPDWCGAGPRCNLLLYSELFGWTDDLGDYVHLSDGGHFENLGVYELVRRRCRYIVAVEAPTDRGASTDSLATMIRLCRIDFGVRIELDTSPLEATGAGKLSRWHCAVGTIHYDDVDGGELPGILVYVRASLTGDEPPDVQEYAAKNPDFPLQSTLDQFFDETQFESHRALGYHVGSHVFSDALKELGILFPERTVDDPDEAFVRENRALFAALKRRWFPPIPDPDRAIAQAAKDWLDMQVQFRNTPVLKDIVRDLFPELRALADDRPRPAPAAGAPGQETRVVEEATNEQNLDVAEVTTVGEMLQVMENAWLALRMESYRDHPMHRGWMNVFRRWSSSVTFQQLWPIFRGQFNRDFVDFCEEELRLQPARTEHARIDELAPQARERSITFLADAFDREWPAHGVPPATAELDTSSCTRGLRGLIEDAGRLALYKPAAWLIRQEVTVHHSSPDWFPCGIALARKDPLSPLELEFFAWVFPPYRGLGLGRVHLGEILKSLCKEFTEEAGCKRLTFNVRHPSVGFERDVNETLWQNFFYQYDFRPFDRHRRRPGEDLVLKACFRYNKRFDRLQSQRVR